MAPRGEGPDLRVYAITPDHGDVEELTASVEQALRGGATCIQLRSKHLSTRALVELGRRIRDLTARVGATFLVNDRPDVALAVQADGVHLGQDDLPPSVARRLLGPRAVIGVSAETVAEARAAERDGATYLGVGPVFATTSKTDAGEPYGPAIIRQITAATRLPVVGIGGIAAHNAGAVIAAGAVGVAAIAAVFLTGDVAAAAARLRRAVDEALASRGVEATVQPHGAFSLHFVADRQRLGTRWDVILARLAQAEPASRPDWVHLRHKGAPAGSLRHAARELAAWCARTGVGLIVNDRCDVALDVGAAGVQLPEDGLPPEVARRVMGAGYWIGRSVHDLEGAQRAQDQGADFLLLGHVFPTASKPGRPPIGTEAVGRVVERVNIPVIAIGGITVDNVDEVLATGCSGIAVVDAIAAAPDPATATADLRAKLTSSPARPVRPFPARPANRTG